MKKITLSGFLNFFTSEDLAYNNNGESGFKFDFSKENLKQKVNSNQSSRSGISSIIILLVLFLFSNFLTAQIITVDGLTSDWSNNPTVKHVQDPFGNGVVDNQFTEGSKDFLLAADLAWVVGQTKAKNDIANGGFGIANQVHYVDANNITQTLNGNYLVFAGDRTSNNGDAQIGFWFYLNSTAPVTVSGSRYFAPPHVRGDLLVLADFTGGGRLGTVKVYRWIGGGLPSPGSVVVDNTNGNLETTNIASIVAENNSGTPNVPVGWNFLSAQYKTNEFYEGFVDLGAIGGNTNFTCSATVLLETRSSQSITASLDDFIGGTLGEVPSVTVNSPAICAGGSTTITASPSPAGIYTYVWTVPQGASNPGNVASFSATVAGSYSVIVTTQAGCPSSSGIGMLTVSANPIVTVNSPVKCTNDAAVNIAATVMPAGTYTYVWTVPVGASNPGNVANFSATVAGNYSVVVSNGTCSGSNSGNLTVNPNPTCSISGSSSVCPNSIGIVHSGPAGDGLTYAWSISGNGSIVGVANGQDVSVTAGGSCGVSYTINLTVTTAQNCSSTCTKTVAVGDSTAPSFTFCPIGAELGCNPIGVPEPGNATATDNCGVPTISSALGLITENGCLRSQTRTYTATDACGNTATCAQVFTWTADTTPPAFTGSYANVELGCNPTGDAIIAALDGATATDACGEPRIAMETAGVQSNGCLRSQTRTFTATDACGNQASISRTVTWTADTTPPAFTGSYANVELGCNPTGDAILAALDGATATDACGEPRIAMETAGVQSNGCLRSQTRTFTATDACGNQASISRTVTWTADTTPPAFTGSYANVELGCNPTGDAIIAALDGATATDACGEPRIAMETAGVQSNGCLRSQTRTFTATDACGNQASISRTVTWTADTTPPAFTGSYANVELGCNPTGDAIIAALDGATATDACGEPRIAMETAGVQSNGCLRSQTRTFTATDACGNQASISRTVTWTADTTPPAFTGSYANVELGCNPTGDAIIAALDGATATDACGEPRIAMETAGVQSNGCLRSQTRTFTATDACGNQASISRTVTWTADTTPPAFTGSYANVELGCNPTGDAIIAALDGATATDACGEPRIAMETAGVQSNGCLRSQTRTFTATDACGNQASISRTVTWTADTTPPAFTGSYANVELGCNPTGDAIIAALDGATATDACGEPRIAMETAGVQSNGCLRSQTRTFTATDACGNQASISRTVTWTADTTPPAFTGSYANVELGCNPTGDAIIAALDGATATDACGEPRIAMETAGVQSNGCLRSQTRTFTATDACGNQASISRTVTWTADTTPPAFTGSYANVELGCNPTGDAIIAALDGATATDACGEPRIAMETAGVQSNGCLRSQTRTFTATDACGNQASISRTVTWTADTTPPAFTGSYANVELGCNPTGDAIIAALDGATATDACGEPRIAMETAGVQSNGCLRSQTRTFTATDACGNQASISRTVTWTADTTPPAFTGSYANVELGCNPTGDAIIAALDGATATDACGEPRIAMETAGVQSNGCLRSQTRTFTATDACGNQASISRTVTWTADTTPPAFTGSYANVELGCNPTGDAILAALDGATATDACGEPRIAMETAGVQSNGCLRSQTRTFTATDACGNQASISRTVTWTADTTPPAFTGSYANVELGCNPTGDAIIAALDGATATDACGEPRIAMETAGVQSNGCLRSQTRTFTATDACGNQASISRTVTWTADTTPPAFTGSYANVELGCNPTGDAILAALDGATATDACGEPRIAMETAGVQSNGCLRSQTRTFTATDACGNQASISRTVTWTADTTPPAFTGSYANVELGCNPTGDAIIAALDGATATDACGEPRIAMETAGVQSNGCLRSQTRTFTATDACGNQASISRTVTWTADTTPPAFTGSYANVELGCNPTGDAILAALDGATATDACGEPRIAMETAGVQSNGCLRSQTRTFTATDACGNQASISRTVTWTADTTPPAFTGSYANVELGCNPTGDAILAALDGATATDACGEPRIAMETAGVQSNGCLRSQTRTFTATDACGNQASISRTVTWTADTTPPAFTGSYANVELGCNPTGDAIIAALDGATATDACGEPRIAMETAGVQSNGCLRSQTRTFTATDACGNQASISRTVTWTADTTPPAFTGSYANVELGCNPTGDAILAALDGATATDACGEPRIAMETAGVQSNGCLRSQTRTFTATDACGNQASISRTVTWTVVTAPVFDNCVSGTTALGCNPTPPTCATDITAYNECGPVKVDCSAGDIIVNGFNRSQTFTYTAAGACGFTSTCERTFTWFVSEPFTCLDPVSTTILCGVTKVKSQENTDAEFLDWLNSFTYDSNIYTLDISYEYDPNTVKADNGNGPKNPNADATAKVKVTWTLTNKETGCKESCSSNFSIENGCRILCSYDKTDVLCEGEETGTITVTASGATLPYIVQLFEDGNPVAIATETSADDAEPFTVTFENLPAGLYSYVVSDDYQRACTTDASIEIGKGEPCGANCTYTQGAYGNYGGKACIDGVTYSTEALIQKALESYPSGIMTIGLPGHSVWMKSTEDIDDIVRVLPGGGSSYVLPAVDKKLSDITGASTYLRKGNINNTLLAQTITLGLNLGVDSELGSFKLQGGVMAIAEPLGGCGSKIKTPRVCNPDGTVTNDYQYYTIPANVVDALTDKTIQGLFDMANKALGNGGVPAGLTLSNIANVVDIINNAFDECKIFVGYDIPACPVPDTVPSPIIELAKVSSNSKIGFDAYPVPFKDVLTIKYKFDYVSNVKIEVINSQGVSILTKNDTNSYLNKEVTLNLKINSGKEQVYFVKVTTNRGSTVKQVLSSTE